MHLRNGESLESSPLHICPRPGTCELPKSCSKAGETVRHLTEAERSAVLRRKLPPPRGSSCPSPQPLRYCNHFPHSQASRSPPRAASRVCPEHFAKWPGDRASFPGGTKGQLGRAEAAALPTCPPSHPANLTERTGGEGSQTPPAAPPLFRIVAGTGTLTILLLIEHGSFGRRGRGAGSHPLLPLAPVKHWRRKRIGIP